METCEDPAIADRALSLHYILHAKHSTLVNVRFLDFAKDSYEFQRTITSEVSGESLLGKSLLMKGHRNGSALLAGWYDLISEKRALRNEFLRALARAFSLDLSGNCIVGFVASTTNDANRHSPMSVFCCTWPTTSLLSNTSCTKK